MSPENDRSRPWRGGPDNNIDARSLQDEARKITDAYESKTVLLKALGLDRRPRMSSSEMRRVAMFARMLERHEVVA